MRGKEKGLARLWMQPCGKWTARHRLLYSLEQLYFASSSGPATSHYHCHSHSHSYYWQMNDCLMEDGPRRLVVRTWPFEIAHSTLCTRNDVTLRSGRHPRLCPATGHPAPSRPCLCSTVWYGMVRVPCCLHRVTSSPILYTSSTALTNFSFLLPPQDRSDEDQHCRRS